MRFCISLCVLHVQPNKTTKHWAPTVKTGGANTLFMRPEQAKHGLIHKDDNDHHHHDDDGNDYAWRMQYSRSSDNKKLKPHSGTKGEVDCWTHAIRTPPSCAMWWECWLWQCTKPPPVQHSAGISPQCEILPLFIYVSLLQTQIPACPRFEYRQNWHYRHIRLHFIVSYFLILWEYLKKKGRLD
jgi:hypothetical protein